MTRADAGPSRRRPARAATMLPDTSSGVTPPHPLPISVTLAVRLDGAAHCGGPAHARARHVWDRARGNAWSARRASTHAPARSHVVRVEPFHNIEHHYLDVELP